MTTTDFLEKVKEGATEEVAVEEIKPAPVEKSIRERLGVEPPGMDAYFSMLVHADPGVGKTHFCGTAGEIGPTLIIDCEGGTHTLRGFPNVDTRRARTMQDVQNIHEDLYKYNKGWYQFVCLDSLSEIQDVDMRMVMKEAKEKSKNPADFNIDVPSPREWGIGRNHVRIVTRGYRDLGINLIVTTLTNTIIKEGKPDRYVPALPGKLGHEIPGFMGIVAHYRFDDNAQKKRVMQFQGTNRTMAKTRFKELGGAMNDPTVPMIYNLIHSKGEGIESAT